MGSVSWILGVMFKVCSERVFSDSVSPKTLFAICDHLIRARYQIIRAERGFYYHLLLAEKFDVIKPSRLVNQAATCKGRLTVKRFVAIVALSVTVSAEWFQKKRAGCRLKRLRRPYERKSLFHMGSERLIRSGFNEERATLIKGEITEGVATNVR